LINLLVMLEILLFPFWGMLSESPMVDSENFGFGSFMIPPFCV